MELKFWTFLFDNVSYIERASSKKKRRIGTFTSLKTFMHRNAMDLETQHSLRRNL